MENTSKTSSSILLRIMPLLMILMAASVASCEPLPGGSLDPLVIPKYADPLVIPPVMPPTDKNLQVKGAKNVDYYEIAVRQFVQPILPAPFNPTTVWSYGSVNHPGTYNYPAFTIEATANKPVWVKWINGLVDEKGNFLPHILPVDPTLHWANPGGGYEGRDMRPMFDGTPGPYMGPVPIVTHVHGAHTYQESDGYPEAWYLPAAKNIPQGYAATGTYYDRFVQSSPIGGLWQPGSAVFQYPNDQKAATLWYHDHALGMTRLNVYAGPAGFYLLRGGDGDIPGTALPGPAPKLKDRPGTRYYEIPIAIQDRSFNEDGSLFYPDNRAFFEGLEPEQLRIPFIGEMGSDISPIWNPEFFGNTIVVNGKTWPRFEVEPRRYRLRLLNGCQSRFLVLKTVSSLDLLKDDEGYRQEVPPASIALPFWQIGTEGGFLPAPLQLQQLLIAPAERADVIVDFTGLAPGTELHLINDGPDEPFGGFPVGMLSDADTTAQVMKFVVVPLASRDKSLAPNRLSLPKLASLGKAKRTRQVSLNEMSSGTVLASYADGNIVFDPENGAPFGPQSAMLGTMVDGAPVPLEWHQTITENPMVGDTEVWEIHNYTEDAHPIHIHQVQFQVVNREDMAMDEGAAGAVYQPEPWEVGYKDTVIAYPGQITRVKARFDIPGLFVWHCHILEHEDNEMMRPYYVGPIPQDLMQNSH